MSHFLILETERGIALIAAVFLIVVFGFFGVAVVSLVGTQGFSAMNEVKSDQAFFIAEGGLEYVLGSGVFPNYSTGLTPISLGSGSFSVAAPAFLTAAVAAGDTVVNVNSTAGFAAPSGRIVIDSEVMAYNHTTGTTFTLTSAATAAHAGGHSVYPVTTLTADPGSGGTTLNVNSTAGFVIPGVIKVDNEYILCNESTATAFTLCARGYRGTPPVAHPANSPLFQYILTATGTIPLPTGSAERVAQVAVDRAGALAVDEPFPSGSVPNTNCAVDPAEPWCFSYTSAGGTSQWDADNAPVSTGGSLEATTNTIANGQLIGYRQRMLSSPVGAGQSVTLDFWYKKIRSSPPPNDIGMSINLVATDETLYTLWSNGVSDTDTSWFQGPSTPFTVPAGKTINRLRLAFDIRNRNAGAILSSSVLFDHVQLTGNTKTEILRWQEPVN